MYFKRKVYNELLEWKKTYSDKYAVCLKVPDGLENRRSRKILPKMNINHIFNRFFKNSE